MFEDEAAQCDTTILKDGSFLYYQFNCDSVWLTMENKNLKTIIFSMGAGFAPLTYRLGYQFVREFDKSILFRFGCAANGPCGHVLVDKNTGREIRRLGELVYKGIEPGAPFVVYFQAGGADSLTIDFIDRNKQFSIKAPTQHMTYNIPEQQFDVFKWQGGEFIMQYKYPGNKTSPAGEGEVVIDTTEFK